MRNTVAPVVVTDEQLRTLKAWVQAKNTPQGIALRAKIILAAVDGTSNHGIARALGVARPTVLLWRRRFHEGGVDALTHIAPGRGRRPTYTAERVAQIVEATTRTKPRGRVAQIVEATTRTKPRGATHWSTRTMAKAQGLSKDTVQRIWSSHGLQPHRTKRYKLSNDPRFTEKLTDVVGLYLNPPTRLSSCAWMKRAKSKPCSARSRGCP